MGLHTDKPLKEIIDIEVGKLIVNCNLDDMVFSYRNKEENNEIVVGHVYNITPDKELLSLANFLTGEKDNYIQISIDDSKGATVGSQLISIERHEQLTKHKKSVERDAKIYENNELLKIVRYIITDGASAWPKNVSLELMHKIDSKSQIEKLVVAGALIAAEIDRVKYVEDNKPKVKW